MEDTTTPVSFYDWAAQRRSAILREVCNVDSMPCDPTFCVNCAEHYLKDTGQEV